jgi:outer membrane lipoprotein-sorting protein
MMLLSVRSLLAVAVALSFVTIATGARADALADVDEAVNRWQTLDYKYTVTTKDADDNKTTLRLRMRMRQHEGSNQQLVHITEPADMKGTKVLTLSPTEMYIYLPQYKKIRRIASHVTEQGFLGTTLSQKDLTLTRYSTYYTGSTKSEDDDTIELSLTAKDETAPYPKLELVVNKKRMLPSKIRYFNEEGKQVKEERRSAYRCSDNYCMPLTMVVHDLVSGKKSTLRLTKWKVNPTLKDELFSKRSLK